MKYLVTGAGGQLGREVVLALQAAGQEVFAASRAEIDLANPGVVTSTVASLQADWVINCAAYTGVDSAEQNREQAFLVNRDGARAVAEGVHRYGGRLLHVSTDFVFSGEQSHPYREDDAPSPIGVYGTSKWEGEQAVVEVMPDALMIRTAWVYGVHGNNFVKTMLRLASERDELKVVDDQIGTPSWTADISRAMLSLIESDATGMFHFTNEGVASWYDFARETLLEARKIGIPLKTTNVKPIPSAEFPTPAKRPSFSVLSKEKTRSRLDYPIPHWRSSLAAMIEQL